MPSSVISNAATRKHQPIGFPGRLQAMTRPTRPNTTGTGPEFIASAFSWSTWLISTPPASTATVSTPSASAPPVVKSLAVTRGS